MEFVCQSCSKPTNIPDKKVPVGKAFNFACPHCKAKVSVSAEQTIPQKEAPPAAAPQQQAPEPAPVTPPPQPAEGEDLLAVAPGDDTIEYYDEGDTVAMICDHEHGDEFAKVMESFGYKVSRPKGIIDAIKKMKFTTYDIVILNVHFDDEPESGYTLHGHLAYLEMQQRRKIFVVRVGENYRSDDNMLAFAESVNYVLNTQDIPQFKTLFERAYTDHQRFYKLYKETLQDRGVY